MTKYTPGRYRKKTQSLSKALKWSISLLTALTGLGLVLSEAQKIIESSSTLETVLYFSLLASVALLVLSWIWTSQHELDLLIDWLDPRFYHPPFSVKEIGMMIPYVPLLAGMVFFAKDLVVFSFIFTAYSVWDAVGYRFLMNYYSEIFSKSRAHLENTISTQTSSIETHELRCYLNIVAAFEHHYFNERAQKRYEAKIACSIGALPLASATEIFGSLYLHSFTSLVYIVLVLVPEVFIGKWRIERDAKIREAAAVIGEVHRRREA